MLQEQNVSIMRRYLWLSKSLLQKGDKTPTRDASSSSSFIHIHWCSWIATISVEHLGEEIPSISFRQDFLFFLLFRDTTSCDDKTEFTLLRADCADIFKWLSLGAIGQSNGNVTNSAIGSQTIDQKPIYCGGPFITDKFKFAASPSITTMANEDS